MPNPRNPSGTCKDCCYFVPDPKKEKKGRCNRYPPTAILEDGKIVASHPPVLAAGWCGEWQGV